MVLLVASSCGGSSDIASSTTTPIAKSAVPTTSAAPTTAAAVATTDPATTTSASQAGLVAACTFDESAPRISCTASGNSAGSQLRWESNISGWNTGPSYEIPLEQEYQLVPEVIVTLEECQGSSCQTVETSVDTSILVPSPIDQSTDLTAPSTTSVPSTGGGSSDPSTSSPAGTDLAVDCNFDSTLRRIWCEASGFGDPASVTWGAGSGWGYQGGTFEYFLVEDWQLLPETVITIEDCSGQSCETLQVVVDTSAIVQTPTTTELLTATTAAVTTAAVTATTAAVTTTGVTATTAAVATTAVTTTQAPATTVVGPTELVATCSFDETQRRLSCESDGRSGGSLKWTDNIDSRSSSGETYSKTFEWGQFIDQIQVQLEECNGSDCSVASWSTTVALQPKGDCPDDFTGWFKTFPLEDYTQILEVGPPGRLVSVSDFKGHGYFRVADWQNVIDVRLPIDGTLYAGSKTHFAGRDAAWDPELNYGLRFRTPCEGTWISFGHILELSPSIAAILDEFPAQDSSETLWFDEPLEMSEGDVIGTAIGYALTGNAMVDFGVHDEFGRVRTVEHERGFGIHLTAACMYDFFSAEIADYLRSKEFTGDPVDEGLCPLRASTPGGP